jgi:hypothetical protein
VEETRVREGSERASTLGKQAARWGAMSLRQHLLLYHLVNPYHLHHTHVAAPLDILVAPCWPRKKRIASPATRLQALLLSSSSLPEAARHQYVHAPPPCDGRRILLSKASQDIRLPLSLGIVLLHVVVLFIVHRAHSKRSRFRKHQPFSLPHPHDPLLAPARLYARAVRAPPLFYQLTLPWCTWHSSRQGSRGFHQGRSSCKKGS